MEPILTENVPLDYEAEMAILVSKWATPLAIFLVSLGIILSQPQRTVNQISVLLLCFSVIFNMGMIALLKKGLGKSHSYVRLRLYTNLAVNSLLLYYLGGYWTPMWLLLALTPLATAIYGSRSRTISSSLLVSALMIGIYSLRRLHSPLEWGVQVAQCAFVFLVSMLVNELTALVRRAKDRLPS